MSTSIPAWADKTHIRMPMLGAWNTPDQWAELATYYMKPEDKWKRDPRRCPFMIGDVVTLGWNITRPSDLTQFFRVTGAYYNFVGFGWLIHCAYGAKPSKPIRWQGRTIDTTEYRTFAADRIHRITPSP